MSRDESADAVQFHKNLGEGRWMRFLPIASSLSPLAWIIIAP